MEGIKGKNHPNYKKIVCKIYVHRWMDKMYGKPKICEGQDCRKNSSIYEWALKKSENYKRNRKCFYRLCRSCHRRYDLTKEKTDQALKNLWWKTGKRVEGQSKLTFKEAQLIRNLSKTGMKNIELREIFNLSKSSMSSIINNKTWTHDFDEYAEKLGLPLKYKK